MVTSDCLFRGPGKAKRESGPLHERDETALERDQGDDAGDKLGLVDFAHLAVRVLLLLEKLGDRVAGQQRQGCFRSDRELAAGAEDRVDHGGDGGAEQAADGVGVHEAGRVRHGLRRDDRGHGEGGDDVAGELFKRVLGQPLQDLQAKV